MAGRGSGTPTTYTIYGGAADGYVSTGANFDQATTVDTTGDIYVGMQVGAAYEGFLTFDTSSVDDGAVITSATLSLYGMNDSSTTDFTLEARIYDWLTSLGTDDFRTRAELGTLTLVASMSTASWVATGYNVLTSDAAFLAGINKTGSTRLVLCSSRHRTSETPSGTEFVGMNSADASGTSQDPKLVIEATV